MATVDTANGNVVVDEVSLAAQLRTELAGADGLRVIGYYGPEHSDTVFVRDDIAQQFTDRELQKPLEDGVLDSMAMDLLEKCFDDTLAGTVRVLGNQRVIYCPVTELGGIVVSVDRQADIDYKDVLSICEEVIADT